jgi:type 1 glutamine amidotransferase
LIAIYAVRRSKHMYCEKLIALPIAETKAVRRAVNRSGVCSQFGTQQRSSFYYRHAVELVRNHRIGELKTIMIGSVHGPNNTLFGTPKESPPGFDYDMWLGLSPWASYPDMRVPIDAWLFISDYGLGCMDGAWGIHDVDIAQWVAGADDTKPVEVEASCSFYTDIRDTLNEWTAEQEYASGVTLIHMDMITARSDPRLQTIAIAVLARRLPGELISATPRLGEAAQIRAFGVLAQTGNRSALPVFTKAAEGSSKPVRVAALEGMARVGDASLVPLLAKDAISGDQAEETAAQNSLAAILRRSDNSQFHAVVSAYTPGAEVATRGALLQVMGQSGITEGMPLLRFALTNQNAELRRAAILSLSAWPNDAPIPDLLAAARSNARPARQVVALWGVIRLAGLPASSRITREKAEVLASVMGLAKEPAEKRAVLALCLDTRQGSAGRRHQRHSGPSGGGVGGNGGGATGAVGKAIRSANMKLTLFCVCAASFLFAQQPQPRLTPAQQKQIDAALPVKAPAKPKKARRMLVITLAKVNERLVRGHPSIPAANYALEQMGKRTGAFEAVFSNDIEMFRPDKIKQFDAVCFNNTQGVLWDDPELKKSLLDFVRGGHGLVGFHAAISTFVQHPVYDQWPEFGRMLGGTENGGHPWGPEDTYTFKVDDPKSPLTAMFHGQGFDVIDEVDQLQEPALRQHLHVLLSVDTSKSKPTHKPLPVRQQDQDFPLSWIRIEGEGRVFCTGLGHVPDVFWNAPLLAHFLAGIQFALGDLKADASPSAAAGSN